MKILITGGSGFVGRNLIKSLKEDNEVFYPSSKELDLTNSEAVDNYFRNKYFDWVIHCAIEGGKRIKEDSLDTTYKNLSMFFNLMRNRDRYDKLINFSTGAEFDRSKDITGDNDVNNHFGIKIMFFTVNSCFPEKSFLIYYLTNSFRLIYFRLF